MRVAKSSYCGVLTRPFEQGGKLFLGVTNVLFASLAETPTLISELALWPFFAEEAPGSALDAVMPKVQGEWLLSGACHPAGGPSPASAVRARVGALEKRLAVFGDRTWVSGRATAPQPFERMPLGWERAFGGAGDAFNPLGKGLKASDGEKKDEGVHPLPNVEYLDRLLATPDQRVPPASFLPLDPMWAPRAQRVGTYDDAWLKTLYPGMPQDFDWRFFNVAPQDQWFAQPMRGDEAYEFENLHPARRVLAGRLPGLVTRTFLNRKAGSEERMEEVSMRLTTAWFFPHAERVILLYHGLAEVAEDDASDVLNLLSAVDRPGALKPIAHYRDVLKKRCDRSRACVEALNEDDLLPAGLKLDDGGLGAVIDALTPRNHNMRNSRRGREKQLELARAEVASFGLDPDEHAPAAIEPEQPMPSLAELPVFLEKMQLQLRAAAEKAARESEQRDKESAALLASLGMDWQAILDERKRMPVGPPTFSARAELAEMTRIRDGYAPGEAAYKDVDAYLQDPAFRGMLENGEKGARAGYRAMAQHQAPAPRLADDIARSLRERVQQHHASGKGFANVNLTGADLSGMDLQGADFSQAFLESAKLDGADLRGCNFAGAVLVRANLQATRLDGADLSGANLSQVHAVGTSFDRALMVNANLQKAQLHSCTLRDALLDGAMLMEALFDKVDLSGAKAAQTHFLQLNLHGVRARGVAFTRCTFLECDLGEADFTDARLDGTGFVGVRGVRACMAHASMRRCCFVQGSDLREADFRRADLGTACFREALLGRADFRWAKGHAADFSLASLEGATFYQADMTGARFVRSHLEGAVLASANLTSAVLQNAFAAGSDFRYANLFRADIARIRLDTATRFDAAYAKRARVFPKWKGEPQPAGAGSEATP